MPPAMLSVELYEKKKKKGAGDYEVISALPTVLLVFFQSLS